MDIDAALNALRDLLDSFAVDRFDPRDSFAVDRESNAEAIYDRLSEACDVFAGLDDWLSRGGALPCSWKATRLP